MSRRNGEDTAFISITVIDRLMEGLRLRNVNDPQPDRELALGDLEAARKLMVDCCTPTAATASSQCESCY